MCHLIISAALLFSGASSLAGAGAGGDEQPDVQGQGAQHDDGQLRPALPPQARAEGHEVKIG